MNPAKPQLKPTQPATSESCQAETKKGKPCSLKAETGGFCLAHDPTDEGKARRSQKASERGKLGAEARKASRQEKTVAVVLLSTTIKIRKLLEEAAGLVMNSSESACTKAHAIARLASVAHTTIATTDLEKQVAELRDLFEQKRKTPQ